MLLGGRERGVGEQPELAGHLREPGLIQPEPVQQAPAQPGCFTAGDIGGVRGEDLIAGFAEQGRHGAQGGVDHLVRGGRQGAGTLPGRLTASGNGLDDIRHGMLLESAPAQNSTEANVAVSVNPTRR